MVNAITAQSIVDHYVNLLIIQYHNQPKARATIDAYAKEITANGVFLDVLDGYNLDTAVGVQLDILGKYVGIDRFYKAQNLDFYFAFTDYNEPTIPAEKEGFDTYANFDIDASKGTLTYSKLVAANFKLDDDAFRILIKLKIIQNYSNHSHGSINDSIYAFFGDTLIPDSNGNMHMIYYVPADLSELIAAAIYKQVLPRPMGVGIGYVTQNDPFFAFTTYAVGDPVTDTGIQGFTNYTTYGTITGETLAYDKIN